ncbi:MAG: Ig-like domain-containing protein [Solirubrobacteraceae bacterium]
MLILAGPNAAFAAANAVIPTSASAGTSTTTINSYQQVNFPANDDGTWPCGGDGNASPACPGPDGETGPTLYPIGFNINFYGTEYNSVYINNNGNVTFSEPLAQFTPSDLTTFGSPIIAPFFADVDTRGAGSAIVNFGTGTLNGQKVFVVNWPGVGCYAENDAVADNFQMILIDRPDVGTSTLGDDFDIEFNYGSIQWDTGEASGGDANCENGPAGDSAFVGFTNGTDTTGDSYELPDSGVPNSFLDSTSGTALIDNSVNSTTLGRYLFTVNAGQPSTTTTLTTSLSGAGKLGTDITVGETAPITDTATLTGGSGAATGTVTYNVYSDSACTDAVSQGTPEPITTFGTMPASAPVTISTPGTYYWQAVYSGDTNNDGSVSTCGSEQETVSAAPTVSGVKASSGPTAGGTTVTITGTNLTGATAVKFGLTPASSFTVVSATEITATSPAGSGTVDVTVSTAGGTSAISASDKFSYTPVSNGVGALAPAVAPNPPVVHSSSGAGFSGTVNPEGQATTAYFEYGLDPKYSGGGPVVYDEATATLQLGSGLTAEPVSVVVSGLLPNALYHVRLVAANSAGTTFGPDETFTTAKDPAPPPPVLGKTVNAAPVSGLVFIKLPGGHASEDSGDELDALTKGQGFIPLTEARQLPSGTQVDARRGTLNVTTAPSTRHGKLQTATLAGAIFAVTQSRTGLTKGLTTFALLEGDFPGAPTYASCPHADADQPPIAQASKASPKVLQSLHASDNHGDFSTKGRYSSATVRGTEWTTSDLCDGTLTTVQRGTVKVFDDGTRKTITLHAHQSYLAKAFTAKTKAHLGPFEEGLLPSDVDREE